MKRIIGVALSLFIMLGITSFVPTFEEKVYADVRFGDYNCIDTGNEITIKQYAGAGGDVTIPSILNGKPVTEIYAAAFYNRDSLTSVTIPGSVKSIGDSAFYGCNRLISVTILDGVKTIGGKAFIDCTALTTVTIADSVTNIGYGAFDSTWWLDNFSDDFVLAGKVLIKYKGNNTDIMIPDNVKSIGTRVFYDYIGLASVTIPDGVTNIGKSAFDGCSSLTSVIIPNSVTNIDDAAFFDCTKLESITIPNSVTSIGLSAFGNTIWQNNYTGEFLIVGKQILIQYKGNSSSLIVPDNIESIGAAAFAGHTSLKSITIPTSITFIGDAAFIGCSGFTSITIPNSVASIGFQAFSDCSNLTSIIIPNSVTSIGYSLFTGCPSNLVVYGNSNSSAQSYSNDNSVLFVDMDTVNNFTLNISNALYNSATQTIDISANVGNVNSQPIGCILSLAVYDSSNNLMEIARYIVTLDSAPNTIIEKSIAVTKSYDSSCKVKALLWSNNELMLPLSVPSAKNLQ